MRSRLPVSQFTSRDPAQRQWLSVDTRIACVCSLLLACALADLRGGTIWIDTDPAIGAPWREVDDAFALLVACNSPELQIAGISTTYGNAPLRRTDTVARELVGKFARRAGLRDNDVYVGAASADDLGTPTAATEALTRAVKKNKLTYLALGPLTNLATFVSLHPSMTDRLESVIFVGGRSSNEPLKVGWLSVHDANVVKDRRAVELIARSKVRLFIVPPETASGLTLTTEDHRKLGKLGTAGEYLYRRTRVWQWFWTAVVGKEGGPLFDAVAVAALHPGSVQLETRYVNCDAAAELIATRSRSAGARAVRFCSGITPATKAFVWSRLRLER